MAPNTADLCRAKADGNYGPIMVQQLFLSALKLSLGATSVAYFQLVTSNRVSVTAFSGCFGNRRARKGIRGSCRELHFSMRGRSSAG
jgi:hypothetical protein